MSLAFWVLLGCGGQRLAEPLAPPLTELEAALASKQVAEGEPLVLTVTVRWAQQWSPDLSAAVPQAEGLTVSLVDERTLDGVRAASIQEWELTGPAGSYEVAPMSVSFIGPAGAERLLESAALYADIGSGGPSSELAPMVLAPAPEPVPWWPFAVTGGAVLLAAGAWWWRRLQVLAVPPTPPIPPDVAALSAWEAMCADPDLDDHGRAVGLSRIFRHYLEAVLPVAATTATSREILAVLELPAELHQCTKRLLTATDLIKFARKGGGVEVFESLDEDLRAVVEATRPRPEPTEDEA